MTSGIPAFDHIVVVVEENHSYSDIIGNTAEAPYINNTLVSGGASLTNYFSITHPSEPNYFALYAGSTFGVTDDGSYSEPDPSLDTVLTGAGKTFTGYVETLSPAKHNPWESFPEGKTVEQDFTSFPSSDFSTLSTVSFVIPDLNDDMHDGTVSQGDTWLSQNINTYAQWAVSHNSLLIVTWDEDDRSENNQVPTIFYGANVTVGTNGTLYDHFNLLSTLLAPYGLTGPRNAATADPIQVFGAACYCRGTLILTAAGEVPIEELAVGDGVATLSGRIRPIKWIGRRAYDPRFVAGNETVLPIRIAPGALGHATPKRELWVSPGHAIYIDGILIAAKLLVNGDTIRQVQQVENLEYFHIELDAHDIVLAEGAAAESYAESHNRGMFQNADEFTAQYPNDDTPSFCYCAPRLEENSAALNAVRMRLAQAGTQRKAA